jgi:hypothetical protein
MDGDVRLRCKKHGNYVRIANSDGSYPLSKPSDSAHLMLVVQGHDIRFFVNGLQMLHRQDTAHKSGNLGLTLISGTNTGFGTSCSMENIELWILDD